MDHRRRRAWVCRCLLLIFIASASAFGHEGHQPLPTKGVQIDLKAGHLTLSRAAREVLDVKSVVIQAQDVTEKVRAYATAVAPWKRHAYVTSRLAGRIVKLHVRPGDAVEPGQQLAELESLELLTLSLDYQKAKTDLELSTRILETMAPAAQSGAVSGQKLIETQNSRRQNQTALDVLRAKAFALQVSETELDKSATTEAVPLRLALTSPIRGVVVHADVAVGKFVEPTEHLFEIVDTSRVWVKIGVLERDLYRVHQGQAARVSFNGLPGKSFDTKIDKLGLLLDPQTHQTAAWAEIANSTAGPQLLPGMSGQAELDLSGGLKNLSVPITAIFSDGAERYVLVEETSTKEGSEYRKKSVVIGRQTRDRAEVTSGDIYPGDRVVTQGGHELSSLFFLGVLRLSPQTAKSISLKVEPAIERSVEKILRVDGAMEVPPQRRTSASSQLAGTLRGIRVDRGQPVKAGDILGEVASLALQDTQLELIKSTLDGAMWRETYDRLSKVGSTVSRRLLLETENRAQGLEMQAVNIRQKLLTLGLTAAQIDEVVRSKHVIDALPVRASMDGVVVHFDRVLGQVIRADEPLFEIHDLSKVWVQAFVGERDSSLVQVGQAARIRLVAYPDFETLGTVARLGPVMGSDNRTQVAWIEFQKPPPLKLQHNMLAHVTLVMDRPPPALALPLGAIVRDGLRSFVFVQKPDGAFDRRAIEIGRADDHFVEIKSGLTRGEPVATSGVPQLQTAYSALR